ncbi:MAG: aldo/keto reductase [Acidobacteriota bacterium]
MKTSKFNRRDFIKTTGLGIGAMAVVRAQPGAIPKRALGQTGEQVSILAFGGGSRFLMYEDEDQALAILNEVIDNGVNYLDTAVSYGNGKSEERYGKVLKDRRKEVFLATKIGNRTYDGAMRDIEASLKRLQTDHVDLLHIHSLLQADDLEKIEAPDGVLKAIYQARDEKMARFIGMTSHTDAATMKTAIGRHDLNCVQMALNAATNTGYATGFEKIALPAALEKGLGVLAMKIAGQDALVGPGEGKAPMKDLLRYSMSLPVATCVVGMPKPEFVRENIEAARTFTPLTPAEKERILVQIQPSVLAFNHFLCNHADTA